MLSQQRAVHAAAGDALPQHNTMAGVAANDALFSSTVLAAAADATDTLWKTHVHPDYVRGRAARLS